MDDWQIEALRLYNAGNDYQKITDALVNLDIVTEPREARYQEVRRFIYKCRLRHPELITANVASDKKIAEEPKPQHATVEYKQDGTVISERLIQIIEARAKDTKYILEAHGFSSDEWDVVSCKNNIWSMNSAEESRVNCQSKITVKPKVAQGLTLKDIDEHFQYMQSHYLFPTATLGEWGKEKPKYMAELNIADLHYSRLSWAGESGENFDHRIAHAVFEKIIQKAVVELQGKNIEYITFVWSNDFMNSDNETQATEKGTPQDCDTRTKKMFNGAVDMLVWGIMELSKIAPVKTFYVRANHDASLSYYALQYLNAWFRESDRVDVDINAYPRKYILYGTTLIGYAHGDAEKGRRLSTCPPLEARELWAKAKSCEIHAAHLHRELTTVNEDNGVIVRRISSPTTPDAWTVKSGYLGSIKKAQMFIYDKEDGLVQITNIPV